MRYLFLAICLGILSFNVQADSIGDDIDVKVNSITNLARSTAMEVCGTAIHKDGVRPLLVTIKHDKSFYTNLSGPNAEWCTVIKRWTFSGDLEVSATTLENPSHMNFKVVQSLKRR